MGKIKKKKFPSLILLILIVKKEKNTKRLIISTVREDMEKRTVHCWWKYKLKRNFWRRIWQKTPSKL